MAATLLIPSYDDTGKVHTINGLRFASVPIEAD